MLRTVLAFDWTDWMALLAGSICSVSTAELVPDELVPVALATEVVLLV